MSGGALFSGGRGGGSGANSRALVEFRAGKMNFNASTKMVTPDKRKGMIQVEQGEEDHLMHFKWKDRANGNVEDDLIIFPDDIEFKAVAQCTTGRVFIMKFKSSPGKNMFFWMQEPKDDKDDEYCKKVNDLLNNPPTPGSAAARGGSGGGGLGSALGGLAGNGLDLSNLGDSELQSLLNNMSQQQLMQLFGGSLSGAGGLLSSGGGSRRQRANAPASTASTTAATTTAESRTESTRASVTTTASTSATATTNTTASSGTTPAANPAIQLSDLQNILSGINVPAEAAAAATPGPAVDLASGLTAEMMQPLLTNPDFVKRLKTFLPAEDQTSKNVQDEIKGTVTSPQFQQALGLFSSAFQSAQLAPLIREFDLGTEAVEAATKGDMEAFVKALQKSGDKKPDAPEDMALD